jgi:TPR repeat protein
MFSAHLCADELSDIVAAAEQGNAKLQWVLGFRYYHGERVPQNYAEAEKSYRKAALG